FVGIILMAIGVLVETHRQKIQSMNNQLALPVALLILVGLIIAVNALCGMVGTLTENITLLKVFLVITVISFLIQVAIGVIAFIYREEVPGIVSSQLMFAIEGYGESEGLTRAMDYLQNRYSCCGLTGYRDYSERNKDYLCSSSSPQACGVPSSCCKNGVIGILLVYFFIRRVGEYQMGYRVGQYFSG
ncbi:hypothetical protein BaRGS_00015974, partial [Batillaria attramentaria]